MDLAAALASSARGYLDFAEDHSVVCDAVFGLSTDLPDTTAPLRAAFDVLGRALGAATGDQDLGLRTELACSALRGLVSLSRPAACRPTCL